MMTLAKSWTFPAAVLVAVALACPGVATAKGDWPLARGDAQSTGRTPTQLPAKLDVLWEFKADGAVLATPVVSQGAVFVADFGDDSGIVYALDSSEGKELWRKEYEDTGFVSAAAIKDGLVVIGDYDGNVYALDAKSGEERWRQKTDGEISGSPSFHDQHVLVTSQDGNLYCFSVKDGSEVWTYATQDQVQCSPTIAGDRTFLGGCDGQLHIVDLTTGKAAGEPLQLGGPTGSTPAVAGNQAFVPIMEGVILAFDYTKGDLIWEHTDEDRQQEYRSSPALTDDLVVVNSVFKHVDAISLKTGKRVWRHTLRRKSIASPVIAGDDVWIAGSDGRLVRLSLKDGEEKWTYEIRGSFEASPAIAGEQLFIGDDDGVVRCFGAKS